MKPEIITQKLTHEELKKHLNAHFGDMIKFVLDVKSERMAVGGEMHVDTMKVLLEDGAERKNLWGARFYPYRKGDKRLEYISMINDTPERGNFGEEIQDEKKRGYMKRAAETYLLAPDEKL